MAWTAAVGLTDQTPLSKQFVGQRGAELNSQTITWRDLSQISVCCLKHSFKKTTPKNV